MEAYHSEINMEALNAKYNRLKNRFASRDTRMAQVRAIRGGRMSEVAPDIFPDAGPWQEPIVANMIDIAARDVAEQLAPLPSFSCTSPTMTTEKARNMASEKTKIALGYITASDLQVQMYSGADQYVTYGFLPFRVEVDYDRKMPIIRTLDPVGVYPEFDRFGRTVCVFQRLLVSRDELIAQFPEMRVQIKENKGVFGSEEVEVVFYHDKNWDLAFMLGQKAMLLEKTPNPLGKCMIHVAKRPGASNDPRGQFDDVIFIQLAKSSMALLALQAAHDSVNAPIIVPSDVPEVPYGPGATIRTNNPGGVGRLRLDLPQDAFREQASLDREMQLGSRFPQVRTGNADASIVTGAGVEALMGGYDTQIRGHQAIFARALGQVISLCFEVDEKIFADEKKTLRGASNGAPFEIEYVPSKTIKGDYTVDVSYGLMAGLDPNRMLVFALQARAEKMFSRDFMRRELPVEIDVEEEAKKLDMEDLEDAAKAAVMQYAQTIPMLASQGEDPTRVISVISSIMNDRRKGKPFVDALADAFAAEQEEQQRMMEEQQAAQEAQMAQMAEQQSLMPGAGTGASGQLAAPAPEGAPEEGGLPMGGENQQGTPPDLASILASLQ